MTKKKRRRRKTRKRKSASNQALKMIGDTATVAIGAGVATHITASTLAALKR